MFERPCDRSWNPCSIPTMNEKELKAKISEVLKADPYPGRGEVTLPVEAGIAGIIDHTLLKPDATPDDILGLCDQALDFKFFSVCISPTYVPVAVEKLAGSDVRVGTVAGFPLGASSSGTKGFEAEEAARAGAAEVDVVMNIGAMKSGQYDLLARDMAQVVDGCRRHGALVKVILETALLSDSEKVAACLLAEEAGAAFVKTSTGFAEGGATLHDVALMRTAVGPKVGVKAAGGIRSLSMATAVIRAGANRIGTSSGVRIVGESETKPL